MAESSVIVDKTEKKDKEKDEWDNAKFVSITAPHSSIPINILPVNETPIKNTHPSITTTTTTTTTSSDNNDKKSDEHISPGPNIEPLSKHVQVLTNSKNSAIEHFKKKNSSTIVRRKKSSSQGPQQQQEHYMITNNNKRVIKDKEYGDRQQREGIPIIYIIYDEIVTYYNTDDITFNMLRWETHSNNGITWIDPNHPYIRVFKETWTNMEWRRREMVEPKTNKLTSYGCDSSKFEKILSAVWKQFHLHCFFDYDT